MSLNRDGKADPLFVLGTGRCGSTLVSDLLRDHPEVLSLSELFNHLTDMYRLTASAFPEGVIPAEQFWSILSSRNTVNRLMARHGVTPKEVLYPLSASTSRYTADTGVPAVLLTTLPHLTDAPEPLYDEMAEVVATFPESTAGGHYARLFGWLCDRYGKRLWAERSGGSLILANQLREHFPDARFLHVLRDGRDCALSMSRHNGFRMAAVVMSMCFALGQDPYELADPGSLDLDLLPVELRGFLPDRFDPAAFRAYDIPASLFGSYWSDEMKRGMEALSAVPKDRVFHLWYEDILERPTECARLICDFLGPGYADEEWIRRCATRVSAPTSSWRALPEEKRHSLDDACRDGFSVLAEHGVHRISSLPVASGV